MSYDDPDPVNKEDYHKVKWSELIPRIRLFPLWDVLKNYSKKKAKADAAASLNVSLLDFTQGMAYALIAGLPVQFGVFCSALATLVGPIFASSRFVMLGPSNATAVMLLSTFLTMGYGPQEAMVILPMLLLLVGIFMTLGAFCRVGGLAQYVSRAVITGYISAAAFLIIVNQLKTVLGLHVPRAGTFIESLWILLRHVGETDWPSLMVAGGTLLVYLPLKKWAKGLPNLAIALIVAAVGTHFLVAPHFTIAMLDGIDATHWPLTLPHGNLETVAKLANAALAIAFLSMLESSSIAKTLAAQAGDKIDLNQQMFSIGIANFTSAFGSGMAVSGSLTRSVLNFKSGAATQLSSVFSGTLLMIGVFSIGSFIAYIPKPSLAVLVITVGISLINRGQIAVMTKTTRSDAVVFLITFISGLVFALDTAIYLGAAASVIFFLRKAARPELREISLDEGGGIKEAALDQEKERRQKIAIVHVEGDLFFASSDIFLDQMRNIVEYKDLRVVILRLRNAFHLDASIAMTIKELVLFARDNGRDVIVSGAHDEIERIFRNSGLMKVLGEENFFRYSPNNPTISTRDALKRAQNLMGTDSASITIFASEKKK